jgi:hypothetical protein
MDIEWNKLQEERKDTVRVARNFYSECGAVQSHAGDRVSVPEETEAMKEVEIPTTQHLNS